MELIKRKILLEHGISRKSDTTYGTMTATTFNFNIMLTQDMDNMGLYTDFPFYNEIPDYTILIDKLNSNGFSFPFMSGVTPPSIILSGFTRCMRHDNAIADDWFDGGTPISAYTSSRMNTLQSYDKNNRFIPNFNITDEPYINYLGNSVNGVSRITNINTSSTGSTQYTFDAENDTNIGTVNQTTGLRFTDFNYRTLWPRIRTKKIVGERAEVTRVSNTSVYYIGEGWNDTNTSLSAITKEEYLFGIINEPEVFDDVFIDRGATTVMEKHLKLSEVESLEHLKWFGNGFYKVTKV